MTKYNQQAARVPAQKAQMRDLESRGVCAFCPEHISKETREPVELETRHWLVRKNDYPYKNTSLHLLLVSKTHVKSVSELSQPAQAEFLSVITKVEKKFGLKSYAVGMRSGDMHFNGGSVEHLHAHIVVGDSNASESVRFKMSSRP